MPLSSFNDPFIPAANMPVLLANKAKAAVPFIVLAALLVLGVKAYYDVR